MLTYQNVPLLITTLVAFIAILVLYGIFRGNSSKEKVTEEFLAQLAAAVGDDFDFSKKEEKVKGSIKRWNNYWGKQLKMSDMLSQEYTDERIGMIAFFVFISVYASMSLIFKNFGIGLIPNIFFAGIIHLITSKKIDTKKRIFEDQIPSFLSILKSNVQAGETPEGALINAINAVDDPLYSELKVAKALAETGTFQMGLRALRDRTYNPTLKFLCGCIELSAKVGSNLEDQIVIIEELLEGRRNIQRKLDVAVNENAPLVYMMSALIPAVFLFTYFQSDNAKDFWFKNFVSWIIFFVVIAVVMLGLFLANRIIKKTGDF